MKKSRPPRVFGPEALAWLKKHGGVLDVELDQQTTAEVIYVKPRFRAVCQGRSVSLERLFGLECMRR